MESVISKLYNGEILPAETATSTDGEYCSTVDKVDQAIEKSEEILNGEYNVNTEVHRISVD